MPPEHPATADLVEAIDSILDQYWDRYSVTPYDEFVEVHVQDLDWQHSKKREDTLEEFRHEGWLIEDTASPRKLKIKP